MFPVNATGHSVVDAFFSLEEQVVSVAEKKFLQVSNTFNNLWPVANERSVENNVRRFSGGGNLAVFLLLLMSCESTEEKEVKIQAVLGKPHNDLKREDFLVLLDGLESKILVTEIVDFLNVLSKDGTSNMEGVKRLIFSDEIFVALQSVPPSVASIKSLKTWVNDSRNVSIQMCSPSEKQSNSCTPKLRGQFGYGKVSG